MKTMIIGLRGMISGTMKKNFQYSFPWHQVEVNGMALNPQIPKTGPKAAIKMPNTNNVLSSTVKIASSRPIKNINHPHRKENNFPSFRPISVFRVEPLGAKINTNVRLPYQ